MQCSINEDYKNNDSNNTNKNWISIKKNYKSKKNMNEINVLSICLCN